MGKPEQLTQKALAKRLGITTRAVRKLHQRDIPRLDSGGYPWPKARDWYIAFKQEEHDRRHGSPSKAKEEAELRVLVAKAEKAELDLAERRGELVAVGDCAEEHAGRLSELRGGLLAFPGKAAPRLVGIEEIPEIVAVLEEAIGELMAGLSDPA